MSDVANPILGKMLDRLMAGLVNGPNLNCRPHRSRQRIDLSQFEKLTSVSPAEIIRRLLSAERHVKLAVIVAEPKETKTASAESHTNPGSTPSSVPSQPDDASSKSASKSIVTKLRTLIEDAKDYEHDTGVPVLNIGFPLLSLPPGKAAGDSWSGSSKRILAPIAFIPITVKVSTAAKPSIEIACRYEGADAVVPNTALLAWLERQSGKSADDDLEELSSADPWSEIRQIVSNVGSLLQLPLPELFSEKSESTSSSDWQLSAAPRTEDDSAGPAIVSAAVLGLFPADNQGLIRDTRELIAGQELLGPIESFVRPGVALDSSDSNSADSNYPTATAIKTQDRLVSSCDPFQSRAVRMARSYRGLVIHGPPGTGKSQTITNIIGDHLARGERVLMVCDKRTALDVVANRLNHLGLGNLCALIHDARHDQRDLYRQVREQLEGLSDEKTRPRAEEQLQKLDVQLEQLHFELSEIRSMLMVPVSEHEPSFHELVGEWLSLPESGIAEVDSHIIRGVGASQLDTIEQSLQTIFARSEHVQMASNPWTFAAGTSLDVFLSQPMDKIRASIQQCLESARAADASMHPAIPVFVANETLLKQADRRVELADLLEAAIHDSTPADRELWKKRPAATVSRINKQYVDLAATVSAFHSGVMDAELSLAIGDD